MQKYVFFILNSQFNLTVLFPVQYVLHIFHTKLPLNSSYAAKQFQPLWHLHLCLIAVYFAPWWVL